VSWKKLLFIAIITYGAYNAWQSREVKIKTGAGQTAVQEPKQKNLSTNQIERINSYEIKTLASFSIQARVLSKEHYRFDREADLSPVDLALGWGPMSDDAVLNKISIHQSNRFYYWHTNNFPIPREQIETHSANMHMIPINDDVKDTLESVRVGQVVNIEGYLVEAKASDGWRWKSSLTRQDTGNGACELILVKKISVH
jgi:hypothetical protein